MCGRIRRVPAGLPLREITRFARPALRLGVWAETGRAELIARGPCGAAPVEVHLDLVHLLQRTDRVLVWDGARARVVPARPSSAPGRARPVGRRATTARYD
ncbi:MAG TPA: hypothetical protein VFK09_10805 [Gemmatimonadales bacterium]|nr:hypothetical protein [Gemmatimonadales bacterium]